MDPPDIVEDGSTAKTAILWPSSISFKPKHSIKVDLPAPGGPVRPILSDLGSELVILLIISLEYARWSVRVDSIKVIALENTQ